MGNSNSVGPSGGSTADSSNQPLFQRLFRRYGVDPVLEDARRQFNPNTIFTMMRGTRAVLTVKPRLDKEAKLQVFVQASLAPGGSGRLCLTLAGEAPPDAGGDAGKLLR